MLVCLCSSGPLRWLSWEVGRVSVSWPGRRLLEVSRHLVLAHYALHIQDAIKNKSVEYQAAQNAKQRCEYAGDRAYKRYGGRGIQFKFAGAAEAYRYILESIGPRPSPEHSLDRIDNEGHYEPGNLRWSTQVEQMANRRRRTVSEYSISEGKRSVINIRIQSSIKEAAVKKAAEQHRSLTAYIEWLILQDTKRK